MWIYLQCMVKSKFEFLYSFRVWLSSTNYFSIPGTGTQPTIHRSLNQDFNEINSINYIINCHLFRLYCIAQCYAENS